MVDIALKSYVHDYGKKAAARAMGVTGERVRVMCRDNESVWLRVKGGVVYGWYIYRSVAIRAASDEKVNNDSTHRTPGRVRSK